MSDDVAMRSCWECNAAHEHLKRAEGLFWCFDCGRMFSHGGFIIGTGGDGVFD